MHYCCLESGVDSAASTPDSASITLEKKRVRLTVLVYLACINLHVRFFSIHYSVLMKISTVMWSPTVFIFSQEIFLRMMEEQSFICLTFKGVK